MYALMWSFGLIQYRFLVDGVWRCDDTKPIVRDEYGMISNEVLVTLVENNAHPAVQLEPSSNRRMNYDEGTILTTVCAKVSNCIFSLA
jgi:5'-AMP-activated protein kinase regulatory gamma subunit